MLPKRTGLARLSCRNEAWLTPSMEPCTALVFHADPKHIRVPMVVEHVVLPISEALNPKMAAPVHEDMHRHTHRNDGGPCVQARLMTAGLHTSHQMKHAPGSHTKGPSNIGTSHVGSKHIGVPEIVEHVVLPIRETVDP
jgi:hypothetical protein